MTRPLLSIRILIPLIIGIVLSSNFQAPSHDFSLYNIALYNLLLLFIISFIYNIPKVLSQQLFRGILANILIFILAILCYKAHKDLSYSSHFSYQKADALRVSVSSETIQKGQFRIFQAKLLYTFRGSEKRKCSGTILVLMKSKNNTKPDFLYGNNYIIPAKYHTVNRPLNAGEFDYGSWLSNQNIYHQTYLNEQEVIALRTNNGNILLRFSLALRRSQINKYRRIIKDNQAFALATALVLGYRSDLDEQTLSAYTKTGTIHALSVSGMHVGIIFFVLDFLLQFMNKNQLLKAVKLALILSLIWGYSIFSGCSPSVLRSAIMISLFILAKTLKKDCGNWHPMCLSAVLLLLYDPMLLFDAGCQLSYLAVAGLIHLQLQFESMLTFRNKWLHKLWSLLCLSTAAQVFTFPFSIWYFHQFPIYFLLSNLFITIPVTLLMYSGIAIVLFNLTWLAPVFEWTLLFMHKGLVQIAGLPYPVIDKIWITGTELVLLCTVLLLASIAFQHKNKGAMYGMLISAILLQCSFAFHHIQTSHQHRLIIFKLSKYRGAALLYGRTAIVLTDMNQEQKEYRFHVQPALDKSHINKIRYFAINKLIP
jgi:competence protein ComEC